MTLAPARWQLIRPPLPQHILHGTPGLAPLQVQILTNRGITDPDLMARWRQPDAMLLNPPETLPDIAAAVARLRRGIAERERFCVIGDCDADGVTASAIMIQALRAAGAGDVRAIISPRLDDGRGLTMAAVVQVKEFGATLCVTVDNGSSSTAEVAVLAAAGIDTIITDHHHLPDHPPVALACINPWRADSVYANPEICGAGLAWQVARALLDDRAMEHPAVQALVELAGLGTQADVVSLTAENRTLIWQGLRRMRSAPSVGMQSLAQVVGVNLSAVTSRDIAFALAPRLNAAGRLGEPRVALDLLMATTAEEARPLATTLNDMNIERQQQTEAMTTEARQQARAQTDAGAPIIFVQNEGWPIGLVGLVAGRLCDEFGRLAVVVSAHGDTCRASLRGPAWFHIADVLATLIPSLPQSGGHAQAGGFTAATEHLPGIHAQLTAAYLAAAQVRADVPRADFAVDAVIPLRRITQDRADLVRALAPYGPGFAEPLFATTNVRILRNWVINGLHLKCIVAGEGIQRAFFWRRGAAYAQSEIFAEPLDIVWRIPLDPPPNVPLEPIIVAVARAES